MIVAEKNLITGSFVKSKRRELVSKVGVLSELGLDQYKNCLKYVFIVKKFSLKSKDF